MYSWKIRKTFGVFSDIFRQHYTNHLAQTSNALKYWQKGYVLQWCHHISWNSLDMFRRNTTGDDICLLHPIRRNMYWFPPILFPMCHRLDEIGLELLSQTKYMISKGYFADLFTEKKSNYNFTLFPQSWNFCFFLLSSQWYPLFQ